MSYSSLYRLPLNRTALTKPVLLTNRIAKARRCPRNIRKLQVKLGDIVYYVGGRGPIKPMRVQQIDDCALWRRRGPYRPSSGYMIYYDLQPLIKTLTGWRAKPFRRGYMAKSSNNWMSYNNVLWGSGWIGHAVDMDQFGLTCAEANWLSLPC